MTNNTNPTPPIPPIPPMQSKQPKPTQAADAAGSPTPVQPHQSTGLTTPTTPSDVGHGHFAQHVHDTEGIALTEEVASQVARKIKARLDGSPGVWFGLGMMGLVGWSIVVPTILGAALGMWLDSSPGSTHVWTLALLMGGLTIGCLNAWHWVAKENRAIDATGTKKDTGSSKDTRA
jgi:ATP synthase protein I